ncbi:MAG: ornithine carbamoyltransferase [Acidimicrobiia bacterium]|nr:ornithine carbamoyltransferase [Acidimicrobiia bacterium]
MRHLLEIDDLSADEVHEVLVLAGERPDLVLAGHGVALLFEKPSLRTRHSTEMAVVQLGGHPVSVRADEISIGVRETPEDIARALSGYHAAIGARVFEHQKLERMAAVSGVPVVNLLSDEGHPLQALADLLTIQQEFATLSGLTLAWVGDYSNVARSLALACALVGIRVRLACPSGYAPTDADLDRVRAIPGADIEVSSYAVEAVKGADVVSTDTWYAMGQEAEAVVRRRAFEGFTVDGALLEQAGERAILLHCLPAHRGEEVTEDALEGPRSRVFVQATNRMHAARAALWFLIRDMQP